MIRTYTMRLKTTKRQDETLTRLLAQLCELYNMGLQQRRDVWKSHRLSISLYNQQKQLTKLRNGVDEYQEFSRAIQKDALLRLDRAFKAFFRRIKSGEKPGFPRFRSHHRYNSFTLDKTRFSLRNGILKIEKLGSFRTKTRCKLKGEPLEIRVIRAGNKWNAQVVMDIGPAREKIAVKNAVGIDLGLTTLATLSNGKEIDNPRWTARMETHLAEANRDLSRKVKGSKNRIKSKERLRKIHQRIAGLRSSYLTAVAKQLVNEYDLIAHENLNIREMSQSRFSKSILDASWNKLIHRLECEAENAGKRVVSVDPRDTTQNCSGCGEKVPKEIWHRTHECAECGLSLGRDHNAAINILDRGMRSVGLIPAGA